MKKALFAVLCLLLALCVCPVLAEEAPLGPEQVLALAETMLPGGATIHTEDCALMVAYFYPNAEGTQESLDAVMAAVDEQAAALGYVPIFASGEGDKVYALSANDLSGATAVVLGESDSLRPSILSGGTRRFAKCNILWPAPEVVEGWTVAFVEQQDTYEENGTEYPCYFALLTPQ